MMFTGETFGGVSFRVRLFWFVYSLWSKTGRVESGRWLAERPGSWPPRPRPPSEWRIWREKKLKNKQTEKTKDQQHGGGWRTCCHSELCVNIRPPWERLSAGRPHAAARAAGIMAAVSVKTDSAGASERRGRGLAAGGGRSPAPGGGGGRSPAPGGGWKRHIVRQLKHRDLNQHDMFQDLIRICKYVHQFVTKLQIYVRKSRQKHKDQLNCF